MGKEFFFVVLLVFVLKICHADNYEDFVAERKRLIALENDNFLGSDLVLSDSEIKFQSKLMSHKVRELLSGFISSDFPPAKSFFQAKKEIEESGVFKDIQTLPKGGVLHIHDFSITSGDWIIKNVTYR
jgi:hypothetical protein